MDIWYIKLFRQMTEWEWYDDPNTKSLFIHLLLTANYETKTWKGIEVPRAHLITGRHKLSQTLWMTEREVRTCVERLKTTKEIAITSTRGFSLWHVINYERYQSEWPEKRPQKRHANDNQTTTTKEDKNIKNIETYTSIISWEWDSQFEKFWEMYGKKVDRKKTETAFNRLSQKDKDEIFLKLPVYIESRPEIQFRKNPLTWLHGRNWEDETIIASTPPTSSLTIDDL